MAEMTAGQRHEGPQAIPLLEQALLRLWPDAVAGDKGSSASDLRNWLQVHDIDAVIPYRADESGDHGYDREAYRERPRSNGRSIASSATGGLPPVTRSWPAATWRWLPSPRFWSGSTVADTPQANR
jgi:hypothetical protein